MQDHSKFNSLPPKKTTSECLFTSPASLNASTKETKNGLSPWGKRRQIRCYLQPDRLCGWCSSEAMMMLPAGQKRCSGPSNMARFWPTGTLSSLRVRWAGWSPSWLVPLRATDESRSKLIFPSGLGYSIGVQSLAGFSWCASRPETERAWQVMKCWFSLLR